MSGWQVHHGKATVLSMDNIDTDQLIPARFMSQPRNAGYGQFLLFDLRRNDQGQLLDSFPLNQSTSATIVIAGRNFGCGSSREAAVYALVDAGIQVVLAPSFGDIFASNAVNNGLLPAKIEEAALTRLVNRLESSEAELTVNLETLNVQLQDVEVAFQLDTTWQRKLINGWDDIDLTQQYKNDINQFKSAYQRQYGWVKPLATNF